MWLHPSSFFTGKGGEEVAKEALNKGADRYIAKNGNPARQCNDLAHAIHELVIEKGEMRVGDLWESDRDKRPSKVVVRSSQSQSL